MGGDTLKSWLELDSVAILDVAKFVPDVTTNRWVIIAEGRSKRPQEAKTAAGTNKICVFCPGFEKVPEEELYRIGKGGP